MSGALSATADMVDFFSGAQSGLALEMETDLQTKIAEADPNQLQGLMAEREASTVEALAVSQRGVVETAAARRLAVEKGVADLIGGMTEVLTESIIGIFTGGLGWSSVVGAVVASLAKAGMQEMLLGTNQATLTGAVAKDAVLSGFQNFLDDVLDLRAIVADLVNEKETTFLRWIGEGRVNVGLGAAATPTAIAKWRPDAAERAASAVQLTMMAVGEGVLSMYLAALTDAIFLDKQVTAENLTAEMKKTLTTLVTRPGTGAWYIYKINPQKLHDLMAVGERAKVNFLFKAGIKGFVSLGRKIAEMELGDTSNLLLADRISKVLWMLTKGATNVGTKTAGSVIGGERDARRNRRKVERMAEAHPHLERQLAHVIAQEPSTQAKYEKYQKEQTTAQPGQAVKPIEEWLLTDECHKTFKKLLLPAAELLETVKKLDGPSV